MEYNIDRAKVLFKYNVKDRQEIEKAMTDCLPQAKATFHSFIGDTEYFRYSDNANTFTCTSQESPRVFKLDGHWVRTGDVVLLDGRSYRVVSVSMMLDKPYSFEIDRDYTGIELEFTLFTFEIWTQVFAYHVLYQLTWSARQIELNTVLSQVQQFGDGQIVTTESPIALYRKTLKRNIRDIVLPYRLLLPYDDWELIR